MNSNGKTADKVTYVGWRITEKCNLRCPFCFSEHSQKVFQEMSLDCFAQGLDILKKAEVRAIGVMGGEPLVYPQIEPIVQMIKDKGFEVILSTNGILLDRMPSDFFKNLNWISLSLDGDNPETNDRIRRQGHFNLISKLIKKYQPDREPYRLKLNTVVHKNNRDKIQGIGEMLRGKRAVWKLLQFTPRALGKREKDRFWLEVEDFRQVAKELRKEFPSLKIVTREYTDTGDLDTFLVRPNGDLLVTYKERPEEQLAKDYEEGYLKIGNLFDEDALEKIRNIPQFVPDFYYENKEEFEQSYL